jgi:hypothetical protein
MVTHQISHNDERSIKLNRCIELRPELPRAPEKASAYILFEAYDRILGINKKEE